jgi:DNA-binding MarR family transcriptional regulator
MQVIYAVGVDELFELALTIKALQRELERQVSEAMAPLGITAAQADALVVIGQAEPLALKELGGLLVAEAGHPSRLVDRLVAAGWVRRGVARDDRRRVELSLTPAGRRLAARVNAAREHVYGLAREALAGHDLEPALDLLRHLATFTSYADLIERRKRL